MAKGIIAFAEGERNSHSWLLPSQRVKVEFCDREYRSIEWAMIGAFSMDPADQRAIAEAKTLKRAYELRELVVEKRPFWSKCRIGIMTGLTEQKFAHEWLKRKLVRTWPKVLVYKSDDTFWGVNKRGEGENRLGNILMIVRDNIRLGRPMRYTEFRKKERHRVKQWRATQRQKRWAGEPYVSLQTKGERERKKRQISGREFQRWRNRQDRIASAAYLEKRRREFSDGEATTKRSYRR